MDYKTETQSKDQDEKEEKKLAIPKPKFSNSQWWRAKDEGRAPNEILQNLLDGILRDQSGRYSAYEEYERLFGVAETVNGDDSFRSISDEELIQNELQNTIETLWAQVFKNKILPAVSTRSADWDEWDRARNLSRWIIGTFERGKLYEKAVPQAGIYSLVHGTGPIRVDWKECGPKEAEITYCAANPRHCFVDRIEARRGCPRSFHFRDFVDRWVLYDMYGANDKSFHGSAQYRRMKIENAHSNETSEHGGSAEAIGDMLTVWESWHLPSGYNSKDGAHCIWIRGCTLLFETFGWDDFPFTHIRFGTRMEGYWGESAVRRLAPTQKLLDKLNVKIDQSQEVIGVNRMILGRNGNGVHLEHLDDVPGGILVCEDANQIGKWEATAAPTDVYADRDNAPRKMRSLLGLSDFEVQQQIPAAMRDVSGAMLERWVDQGQARHAMFHAEYENAIIDLVMKTLQLAEDLDKAGYKLVASAPPENGGMKDELEELDYSACRIDIKRMKVSVQPMSQLPQTFAGKVEAIEKMKRANIPLDPKTALRMLEVPDVQSITDQLVSDEEIIFKNLCHMTRTGEYVQPLPFDNLDLIIQMTTRYINRYRIRKDADYNVIGLLAQYIDDALVLKNGGLDETSIPPNLSTVGALGGPMPAMAPPPGAPPMLPGQAPPMPGQDGAGMPPMPSPGLPPQIPPMM